ncbi:uncharacterized protein B0H18DRAFT_1017938 [Fomitopsis serialis]|uniref:uncharacterized protein n=1 Tax=Fomitopsis serialis TaxID=139415 RepID=UPI0020082FBD|nr:uncharacterized protein B0H18DRAFT_1017938 [Neoantrodia serialis]KAH9922511.1 hypothetical protein B0H18DRAFT_1017938 [Neoantrodia serialis]
MAMPIVQWIRTLLRLLLSSRLVRHSAHGLLRLWHFLKDCYTRTTQDGRSDFGGEGSCRGRRLTLDGRLGESEPSVVYASREPVSFPAGYLEQARNSMYLSAEGSRPNSRPASRPSSALFHHSQKGSEEDITYPISVQTASQPSRNSSQVSFESHQYRPRASIYSEHLAAPSSRPSSRASVRATDHRLSGIVTVADAHRRRGRSRSRARSQVRAPAGSHPRPESVLSVHGDKASVHSRSNVASPARPSQHLPNTHPRRSQKIYPTLQTRRYEKG